MPSSDFFVCQIWIKTKNLKSSKRKNGSVIKIFEFKNSLTLYCSKKDKMEFCISKPNSVKHPQKHYLMIELPGLAKKNWDSKREIRNMVFGWYFTLSDKEFFGSVYCPLRNNFIHTKKIKDVGMQLYALKWQDCMVCIECHKIVQKVKFL